MPNWGPYYPTATNVTTATSGLTADWAYRNTTGTATWAPYVPSLPPLTAEQQARQDRQMRRFRRFRRSEVIARREAKEANEKAKQLLQEILGPDFVEYQKVGYIELDSRVHPGKKFRVRAGEIIEVMEDDRIVDRLCIHTSTMVPDDDQMIAKLLTATLDEENLWKTALRHGPGV